MKMVQAYGYKYQTYQKAKGVLVGTGINKLPNRLNLRLLAKFAG
jgi:hypothetical protein